MTADICLQILVQPQPWSGTAPLQKDSMCARVITYVIGLYD